MRHVILAAALAALPMGAFAQAYEAVNRLVVVPLGQGDFEVIEAHGAGPRGIWCAAADFAQKRLGLPGSERIYVKQARGPSVSGVGRNGVIFTADVARLSVPAEQSYSLSVRREGMGLPAAHAQQFCIDYILDVVEERS
ncbi:MAG: hypothetical protein ACSHWZ_05515 [Sulfitobacter sp.]